MLLWGDLCQHRCGGGTVTVLADQNSCQMQVSSLD